MSFKGVFPILSSDGHFVQQSRTIFTILVKGHPRNISVKSFCKTEMLSKVFSILSSDSHFVPGRVAQSVGHLTRKSGVLGSIPSLATYFRFSFRFFKKGSCQLLAKVCARSTG